MPRLDWLNLIINYIILPLSVVMHYSIYLHINFTYPNLWRHAKFSKILNLKHMWSTNGQMFICHGRHNQLVNWWFPIADASESIDYLGPSFRGEETLHYLLVVPQGMGSKWDSHGRNDGTWRVKVTSLKPYNVLDKSEIALWLFICECIKFLFKFMC